MKRLLVTGASGFLGWNISQVPQSSWKLIGIHQKNVPSNIESYPIDLTKKEEVFKILKQIKPNAILHMAAISNVGYCEKEPNKSYQINVESSKHLAAFCQSEGIPFLFTSSEQVFNGLNKTYSESDSPNPCNIYGRQKAEAERIVSELCPNACIVRLSVLFGKHGKSSYCFMTDWLNKWKNGQKVIAFKDEVRTFLSSQIAAEALFFLLKKKKEGIYHIAGKDAFSRYEFALLLSQVFGYANAEIEPALQKNISSHELRPPRLVLNCDKLEEEGFSLRALLAELKRLT